MDAVLRAEPRVGAASPDFRIEGDDHRRTQGGCPGRTVQIDDVRFLRPDPAEIKVPRAAAVRLLRRREQKLQLPVRDLLFLKRHDSLQNFRDGRSVVAAEHSGAVGGQHILSDAGMRPFLLLPFFIVRPLFVRTVQNRLSSVSRSDRIQMGGKQDRCAGQRARDPHQQIAGRVGGPPAFRMASFPFRSERFCRVVLLRRHSHRGEPLLQRVRNLSLMVGFRVKPCQPEKSFRQSVRPYHGPLSSVFPRCAVLSAFLWSGVLISFRCFRRRRLRSPYSSG